MQRIQDAGIKHILHSQVAPKGASAYKYIPYIISYNTYRTLTSVAPSYTLHVPYRVSIYKRLKKGFLALPKGRLKKGYNKGLRAFPKGTP